MSSARPVVVGIAGGSGSGKTWLSQRIASAFAGKVARVSLDDFYRDRSHLPAGSRRRVNYDHPRAIDWELLQRFLEDYRNGREASLPRYDFQTHCRSRSFVGVCELKPILIVEGLWVLWRREVSFDLSIYLECPEEVRLQRRIARDTAERGRSAGEVRAQFRGAVAPMHNTYVAPQKRRADMVLEHPISEADVKMISGRLCDMMQGAGGITMNSPRLHGWPQEKEWRYVVA